MLSEEKIREKARLRAEVKLGFYVHLAVYSGVNVLLFFIWLFTGGFPWFVFPLLGWGVGLLAHFLWAFAQTSVTDRLAEKEYRRLKEEQQQR
jgi:putative flippase GtrA